MNRRLALTKDGRMTWCTAPEDKIGIGRCNHISHQYNGESPESFGIRAESYLNALEDIENLKNIDSYKKISNHISLYGMQTKFYNEKTDEYIKLDSNKVFEGLGEELVSLFLDNTNINHVKYKTDYVLYKNKPKTCCISKNFKKEGEIHITFHDLISNEEIKNLYKNKSMKQQFDSLLNFIYSKIEKSGGKINKNDIRSYMLKTIALDCIVLNPDRHMGNLGFVVDKNNNWRPNPQFDNGLALCTNFKDNMYNLKLDYEKCQNLVPMSMFLSDDPEDYINLYFECLNEKASKNDIIFVNDRNKLLESIKKYENDIYGLDVVNRSKNILLNRLIQLEGSLWMQKE